MSRYIATTLLAVAAALVTVVDLAVNSGGTEGAPAAFLVR